MEEIRTKLYQLKRQWLYAHHCESRAPHNQRLWWKGYMEALNHVIDLLRGILNEKH